MRAALHAFAEIPVAGRRWIVLGDMLELGDAARREHEELGRLAAAGDWEGLLTVGGLAAGVADAAGAAGMEPERICRCADPQAAAAALRARAQPGDAILLKGSRGLRLERVVEALEQVWKGEGAKSEKPGRREAHKVSIGLAAATRPCKPNGDPDSLILWGSEE
jgi:UDP-N-acetylmuramoyl-tripeptide--D-alanyl-D-alanine ligase